MGMQAQFRLANRLDIEDEIERLIGLLDLIDAPDEDREPELDYCQAGDDGCGAYVEHGVTHWGSRDEDPGVLRPLYAVDQSAGPINEVEAVREWQEAELAAAWRMEDLMRGRRV